MFRTFRYDAENIEGIGVYGFYLNVAFVEAVDAGYYFFDLKISTDTVNYLLT